MPGQPFDERHLIEVVKPASFNAVARARIERFQEEIEKLPQHECPVKHYFVDGLYVREISIPAGCALVGYIHMQECVTIISKGVIAIADGENEPTVLTAPFTRTCAAGTKKAGYALQDTIWSDCYVNADNERDIETLERRLTADTHEQYLERQNLLESRT